jgi:CXXC-20-CXXC protein
LKILTHKYCPVCQTKVEWKRFAYKNWGWSKWNCPTCNTKLTFNLKRRLVGAVFFMIIGFILVEVSITYKLPTIVYFLILALFWISFFLNDGVIVDKSLSKEEEKLTRHSKKPFYIALFILLLLIIVVYLHLIYFY